MTGDDLDGTRKAGKAYEQIIAYIRGEISSGQLRPGDRLPPETDLARSRGSAGRRCGRRSRCWSHRAF